MTCDEIRERLSAWIDGELADVESRRVDEHVESCPACREHAASLRELDGSLSRLFADQATSADSVADRVVASVGTGETVTSEPPTRRTDGRNLVSLLLAVAVGFLFAVVLFRPWRVREVTRYVDRIVRVPAAGGRDPVADVPGIARFVAATGPVSVRTSTDGEWTTVPNLATFRCPSNAEVRTEPGTRAEMQTEDGCVIRLDDATQVVVKSRRSVELGKGQIWCSSPDDVPFEVVTRDTPHAKPLVTMCSPGSGSSMWSALPVGGVRVTASGDVALRTPEGERRLGHGESVVVRDGKVAPLDESVDPILATRWIHPLLARKGHGDRELDERVDGYLARIGRTKLSHLYEQEVRSLGEYAALPMLKFVQSPISRDEPIRRRTAAGILADVAPSWMVGDLITLLSDDDATVRASVARGLLRLTALDHGRRPDEWAASPEECAPSVALWRAWWAEHRERYPAPLREAESRELKAES